MFDRKRDPNNLEELMVSEFMANKEKVATLEKQLDEERIAAAADHDELMELLQAEEAKSANLQSIVDKDQGIVDLQAPILLYKSNIASDYYFKDWLDDHADDTGEGEGLQGYIDALALHDEACIAWFKDHKRSGYSSLVSQEKRIFKFTIQVPVFGIFAYDPEYHKTQLIGLNKEYRDDTWVNIPLEEFNKGTAIKIREMANKALKKYKKEQEETDG